MYSSLYYQYKYSSKADNPKAAQLRDSYYSSWLPFWNLSTNSFPITTHMLYSLPLSFIGYFTGSYWSTGGRGNKIHLTLQFLKHFQKIVVNHYLHFSSYKACNHLPKTYWSVSSFPTSYRYSSDVYHSTGNWKDFNVYRSFNIWFGMPPPHTPLFITPYRVGYH